MTIVIYVHIQTHTHTCTKIKSIILVKLIDYDSYNNFRDNNCLYLENSIVHPIKSGCLT